MRDTFQAVKEAIAKGVYEVSYHAYRELEADLLLLDTVLEAIHRGDLIEDYPDDPRGPSCLVCAALTDGNWVHTVWGWDEVGGVAIMITAYRPDPKRWEDDFKTRRR